VKARPSSSCHGLTATHRYWLQNIAALAERRRVIALDLVGFGR
jgi:pimeloyl-ACP methyl ester carboxylesterase